MPCDAAVVHALPSPDATAKPVVVSGRTESYGVPLAGAKITWLSQAAMGTWATLLAHPEDADDWLPPSLGTKQAERLDPTHLYQQNDISLLGGIVRIQRQAVVAIHWEAVSSANVRNCWWVEDPAAWRSALTKWPYDADFLMHGQGGWDVYPVAGGVSISYAFWAEATTMLPQIQAWGMSRTLPDLATAFEAQALRVQAGGATP
jgi:hypothetical protein